MNKREVTSIGENIYTVEFDKEIKKGEPFLYIGIQTKVLIAENDINVHDNSTHIAIISMKKKTKNNIKEGKGRFTNLVIKINYDNDILPPLQVINTNGISFIEYWTEHGENDRKMRFEKQTSFDIKRRLLTWRNNSFKNNNKINSYYDKYPDLFNKDGTRKTLS